MADDDIDAQPNILFYCDTLEEVKASVKTDVKAKSHSSSDRILIDVPMRCEELTQYAARSSNKASKTRQKDCHRQ